MNKLKYLVASFSVLALGLASLVAPTAFAVKCKGESLLLFPAWYNGVTCVDGRPSPVALDEVWAIVLNIVQWIIIAAGYVALIFIISGGFKYVMSQGDPSKLTQAKNAITNSVIGLVIVLAAVMIVRSVENAIVKGTL